MKRVDLDASGAGEIADSAVQPVSTLGDMVADAMDRYFDDLDGQPVTELYDLVLSQVEPPLLRMVLARTGNNQTLAARMLGLSRGTLRKKLQRYGLL